MNISTSIPLGTARLLDATGHRTAPSRVPATGSPESSFAGALNQALRSVSAQQSTASRMAEAFQSDPAGQSLEQTMVAMQKAQIGFQSALHVRNRLVSAYSDIMNMQV